MEQRFILRYSTHHQLVMVECKDSQYFSGYLDKSDFDEVYFCLISIRICPQIGNILKGIYQKFCGVVIFMLYKQNILLFNFCFHLSDNLIGLYHVTVYSSVSHPVVGRHLRDHLHLW